MVVWHVPYKTNCNTCLTLIASAAVILQLGSEPGVTLTQAGAPDKKMKNDTNIDNQVRIPVHIEYMDGRKEALSLISPRALLKLHELINREDMFLDAETPDGERVSIAKVAVRSVRNHVIPAAKDLKKLGDDKDSFDPHHILKVSKEDTADAIHQAYLALVREYHPDRFASLELPSEVTEYLSASLRRINVAYDMISTAPK